MYSCRLIENSVGPSGVRLVTFVIEMPRFILAEFNTHRVFSRNSASTRAIPISRQLKKLEDDAFFPEKWLKNRSGMVGGDLPSSEELEDAKTKIEAHLIQAMRCVEYLTDPDGLNMHKSWAGRYLEPFMWHEVLFTTTEINNFANLRTDENAQPEFQEIAKMIYREYTTSAHRAKYLKPYECHAPFGTHTENLDNSAKIQECLISAGRCATVSYDNLGEGEDHTKDIIRAKSLLANGHMSPFEHQAFAVDFNHPMLSKSISVSMSRDNLNSRFRYSEESIGFSGNLRGWIQFRKMLPSENVWSPKDNSALEAINYPEALVDLLKF